MKIIIRKETAADIQAINQLNQEVFGQAGEAKLVDVLRHNCRDCVSLVAIDADCAPDDPARIVGHILFSPVSVQGSGPSARGMGLGPMAVLPSAQRKGVGAQLVKEGVATLNEEGWPFVILVGHPDYYPRFGFEPASRYKLYGPWPGLPDEAFMVRVLDPVSMAGVSGKVHCRPEFGDLV